MGGEGWGGVRRGVEGWEGATAFLVFIHHIIVFHGFALFFDVFN